MGASHPTVHRLPKGTIKLLEEQAAGRARVTTGRKRSAHSPEEQKPAKRSVVEPSAVDFEGTWQRQGSTTRVIVTGDKLTWLASGDITPLKYKSAKACWPSHGQVLVVEMILGGNSYFGELKEDSKIYWSDGDVWLRVQVYEVSGALKFPLSEQSEKILANENAKKVVKESAGETIAESSGVTVDGVTITNIGIVDDGGVGRGFLEKYLKVDFTIRTEIPAKATEAKEAVEALQSNRTTVKTKMNEKILHKANADEWLMSVEGWHCPHNRQQCSLSKKAGAANRLCAGCCQECMVVTTTTHPDVCRVVFANMGGTVREEHDFPSDATLLDLQGVIKDLKPRWMGIIFYSKRGSKVDTAERVRDHRRLTCQSTNEALRLFWS